MDLQFHLLDVPKPEPIIIPISGYSETLILTHNTSIQEYNELKSI
ncbi:hypothetical protein [Bacillus litorisediminis]|nr:hypothetical protein [Bacillus litorisediminis]